MTTGVVDPAEVLMSSGPSGGGDLVDLLVAQNRRVAHEQARLLELVHRVVRAAPDPRFGVDEVAFALTWTHQAAASQEHLAHQLIMDLPGVFTALEEGRIDLPKARVFADVLGVLEPHQAGAVAAEVLPVAAEKTTGQLRDRLHRRALAADPQHTRKRRERGQAERRAILEPADDGTASLSAFGLAPGRAAAAYERVTAIAKAKKLAGAVQTMAQLRADTFLDLLEGVDIGATPGSRRGVVELTVGLETVAELNNNPGMLAGYGPIAADIARQCAMAGLDYQWRFSVTDDQTGELLFQGLTHARPTEVRVPCSDPQRRPSPQYPPADAARRGEPAEPQQHPAARTPSQPAQPRPDTAAPRPPTEPTQHDWPAATEPDTAAARPPAEPTPQHRPTATEPGNAAPRPPTEPTPQDRPAATEPGNAAPRRPAEPMPQDRSAASSSSAGQRLRGRTDGPMPPAQDPDARFPNRATARWITSRDRTCRAPGCRRPARSCDIDHSVDFARGGPTTHDNLGALCRRHHVMKHDAGWLVIQPRPGHFVWVSPRRRVYVVRPEPP